jgi:hypothetical protein
MKAALSLSTKSSREIPTRHFLYSLVDICKEFDYHKNWLNTYTCICK